MGALDASVGFLLQSLTVCFLLLRDNEGLATLPYARIQFHMHDDLEGVVESAQSSVLWIIIGPLKCGILKIVVHCFFFFFLLAQTQNFDWRYHGLNLVPVGDKSIFDFQMAQRESGQSFLPSCHLIIASNIM